MLEIKAGRRVRRYAVSGAKAKVDAFLKASVHLQEGIQQALQEKNAAKARVLEIAAESMLISVATAHGIRCERVRAKR